MMGTLILYIEKFTQTINKNVWTTFEMNERFNRLKSTSEQINPIKHIFPIDPPQCTVLK